MGDPLLGPVLRRVDRAMRQAAGIYVGTVTAIDVPDGSVTVALAAGPIPGVGWASSQTPVVGDTVIVARADSAWVVLGRFSRQLGSPTVVQGTAIVLPAPAWSGLFAEDFWTWAVSPTSGPLGGPAGQGRRRVYTVIEQHAAVWVLPVAGAVPTGATVTAARLRVTRWTPNAEQLQMSPESTLVTPRLYLHAHTALPVGAPSWTSTVWSPGSLAVGQSGSWELPSAWLTALLAGTARGVGAGSSASADWTRWAAARVELAYTIPA